MVLELANHIKNGIKNGGPVTFAKFMNDALYHPQYGYYMGDGLKIGSKGDFYTSPLVSPLFGAMLARQISDVWEQMGEPGAFTVLEYGAGTGKMASAIMNELMLNHCELYRVLNYKIVEISSAMRDRQMEEFSKHRFNSGKFSWHNERESYDNLKVGCVLSNEYIDSLPFHKVIKQGGRLLEVYVNYKDGEFVEETNQLSTPEIGHYFKELGIVLKEGYSAEVNLNALAWMADVADKLEKGFVITIDYGYEASELYNEMRRDGTIRCFKDHSLSTCPYESPGLQDITASINFTALMKKGGQVGLKNNGLVSQQEFLLNLGIMDFLADGPQFRYDRDVLKKALAAKHLIMPQGMGRSFKVLIQSKKAEHVKPLGLGTKAGK